MSGPLVLYETDSPLARIILNQPEKLNLLSNALRDECPDHRAKDHESVQPPLPPGRGFRGR